MQNQLGNIYVEMKLVNRYRIQLRQRDRMINSAHEIFIKSHEMPDAKSLFLFFCVYEQI